MCIRILIYISLAIIPSSCDSSKSHYSRYFLFNTLQYSRLINSAFVIGFDENTGYSGKVCDITLSTKNHELVFNDAFIYHDNNHNINEKYSTDYKNNNLCIHDTEKNETIFCSKRINRGELIGNAFVYMDIFDNKIITLNLIQNKEVTIFHDQCLSSFAATKDGIFTFCNGKIKNIVDQKNFEENYSGLVTEAGGLFGSWIWFSMRRHEKTSDGSLYFLNTNSRNSYLVNTDNKHSVFLKEINSEYVTRLCDY